MDKVYGTLVAAAALLALAYAFQAYGWTGLIAVMTAIVLLTLGWATRVVIWSWFKTCFNDSANALSLWYEARQKRRKWTDPPGFTWRKVATFAMCATTCLLCTTLPWVCIWMIVLLIPFAYFVMSDAQWLLEKNFGYDYNIPFALHAWMAYSSGVVALILYQGWLPITTGWRILGLMICGWLLCGQALWITYTHENPLKEYKNLPDSDLQKKYRGPYSSGVVTNEDAGTFIRVSGADWLQVLSDDTPDGGVIPKWVPNHGCVRHLKRIRAWPWQRTRMWIGRELRKVKASFDINMVDRNGNPVLATLTSLVEYYIDDVFLAFFRVASADSFKEQIQTELGHIKDMIFSNANYEEVRSEPKKRQLVIEYHATTDGKDENGNVRDTWDSFTGDTAENELIQKKRSTKSKIEELGVAVSRVSKEPIALPKQIQEAAAKIETSRLHAEATKVRFETLADTAGRVEDSDALKAVVAADAGKLTATTHSIEGLPKFLKEIPRALAGTLDDRESDDTETEE